MAQALQRARQVARIIQVSDPGQAHSSIFVWFARLVPFLNHFDALATLLMKSLICRLTLATAVVYLVAGAIERKFSKFIAVRALGINGQIDTYYLRGCYCLLRLTFILFTLFFLAVFSHLYIVFEFIFVTSLFLSA